MKNNPQIEIQLTLHKLSSLDPLLKIKNKKGEGGGHQSSLSYRKRPSGTKFADFMSKIKTFIKSCIGFHCQIPFVYLSGVTSHAVHIGGVKVTNNVFCKWKCHFGATYMDGMTFIFDFKRDLMMIAYAKCKGFLTVGYF